MRWVRMRSIVVEVNVELCRLAGRLLSVIWFVGKQDVWRLLYLGTLLGLGSIRYLTNVIINDRCV